MGFNGNILGLKVENAQPQQIITEEEKLINEILQDNAMNSTGCLDKCGIQVANTSVATTAALQKIKSIKQKKTELLEAKAKKEAATKVDAFNAFKKTKESGADPSVKAKDSKKILKHLLPNWLPMKRFQIITQV